jgi:hypothetical protein
MSATAIGLHEFIEEFRQSIPDVIHPAGAATIQLWFGDMHAAAHEGDLAEVARLTVMIRDKLAFELEWEAKKRATFRHQ